jgi:hypothetical protein
VLILKKCFFATCVVTCTAFIINDSCHLYLVFCNQFEYSKKRWLFKVTFQYIVKTYVSIFYFFAYIQCAVFLHQKHPTVKNIKQHNEQRHIIHYTFTFKQTFHTQDNTNVAVLYPVNSMKLPTFYLQLELYFSACNKNSTSVTACTIFERTGWSRDI